MAGKTTRVVMPQLGESVHEGTISKWLVKPGDKVVEFEPMLEVDTDKVNAEVPAPVSGILREILAKEGETVQAGAEIAVVEVGGDGAVTATPEAPAPAPKTEAPKVETEGAVPTRPATPADLPGKRGGEAPHPAPSAPTSPQGGEVKADLPGKRGGEEPHRYSPGVQMAASELKVGGENMARAKATIPHAWQTQEVDMSGVVANRNASKGAFQKQEGFSLTYLPYVMAAAVSALREHREVNSTFNETDLIVHRDINLGISVGMEDTLLVPVVRRADGLSIAGLARAVNDLATRARNKQLKADELAGATFTVNNSGTFGTLFSYSVINPGQAGILTMEAIVERPVAVEGMIGIKPMMYLCFSFDHRVLDGLQAARFLTSCRKWLEAVSLESPLY